MSFSVSLAPLHYCLIAISAKQASSQNDYYELACVSSLCIMQSPCHALQQRLAHTHRRTRAHTETQTDMLWHDTSTHTLQLSCKCLAPIVLVAVLLLPSKSVLKISPWSVCRHLSVLPPLSYSTCAQPASHFTYSTSYLHFPHTSSSVSCSLSLSASRARLWECVRLFLCVFFFCLLFACLSS